MALWQRRGVALLMCYLLVVARSGVESLATPGFEDFGNFGGFRGFHQFHGWLSSALDDNTGSQTQGFPAGPAQDDDVFSHVLHEQQEQPDLKQYQAKPKSNSRKSRNKLPEVNRKSKKLSTKPTHKSDYEARVPYDVNETFVHQDEPRHNVPVKQRVSTTDEETAQGGDVYGSAYESLKLQQKHQPSGITTTSIQRTGVKKNHVKDGIYRVNEPISHRQNEPKPSKHTPTPKLRVNTKDKYIYGKTMGSPEVYKPSRKQKRPITNINIAKPATTNGNDRQISSASYVGNNGGFQPILPPRQEQFKQAKLITTNQLPSTKGNNLIYVYPGPYQQTLAAIEPHYRRVIKLHDPMEHRRNYLSYKSMLSTQVY